MSSDEIIFKDSLIGQLAINYHGRFVPVCVCVMCTCSACVHKYVLVWMHMCACVYGGQRLIENVLLMLSTISLTQGFFSLDLDHTDSAIQSGQWVPEIFLSASAFPVLGIEAHTAMAGFLRACWVWTQVLMLARQTLYHLSHLPILLWRIFNDLYYKKYKSNMKYFSIYYRVYQKVRPVELYLYSPLVAILLMENETGYSCICL